MTDDYVVRLDVFVDDADDLVAVVHCLQHVLKEEARLPELDTLRDDLLRGAIFLALLVVGFELLVQFFDHISESAVLVVVSHYVNVTAIRVVDNLV